jgi:predicted metalloprotease
MRWTPGGESQDIEDRRDQGGGGGGGFGFGGMRLGIGGIIILGILSLIFKQNFFALLGGGGGGSPSGAVATSHPNPARDASEQPLVQFVSFVLDDTQKNWTAILPQQASVPYRHAKLVLFRDATQSGCGGADAATGPFYCPADEKVYIDLGFYDELKQRSVALELQADCFAGVWAHSTQQRGLIDPSDIQSALGAAAAVGDDHIQKMTRGRVQPETFTHGSSQQRMDWFNRGLNSGNINSCNTFSQ